jgi:hypothetical protein
VPWSLHHQRPCPEIPPCGNPPWQPEYFLNLTPL